MLNPQLINTVLDWERRLEIEAERQMAHRSHPYVNYLAPVQLITKQRRSFFDRLFHRVGNCPPASRCSAQEYCREI